METIPLFRKRTLYLALLSVSLSTNVLSFKSAAQFIRPLEPSSKHYKTLAALDSLPDANRVWMDTVAYPWAEYHQGALTYSLMRTHYLKPDDEKKLPVLIRYPANSSAQTRAELDYMFDLQRKRTKQEIDRVTFIGNIGSWPDKINPNDPEYDQNREQLFYIARPVIGEWFNPENFPATTQLLLNCIQDIRVTEFRLKRYFKRPRPYHLEPDLRPLTRIHSPSFPSGHTLWAFTFAFLFSEIIPEKRARLIEMAEEVRWSRELMGIHYPSDDEAARVISWHLLKYWYRSPDFAADMEKAKAEWERKKDKFQTE